MLVSLICSINKVNYIFFVVDCFCLTLTLGSLTLTTFKPSGNQENKQNSYENVGVSGYYESLNLQNMGTSAYQSLHLNNKDSTDYSKIFSLNAKENDKDNNRWRKDHEIEGIIIN